MGSMISLADCGPDYERIPGPMVVIGPRIVKTFDGLQGLVIPLVPQNQHNDNLIHELFKYPRAEHWGDLN
jgi:hypothetical protein